jgi:GWxTD domain-containing protein
MNMKKVIVLLFLLASIFARYLYSQDENTIGAAKNTSDIFCEAFSFKSDQPGKGRVDIYIQIPYTGINFVKEDERYVSRLELSATILNKSKQLWQKNQTMELSVKDFTQTLSDKRSTLKQLSADLDPGKYELVLQITDEESKTVRTINKEVEVKNLTNDSLALSDIMLVRRMNMSGERKEIVPNLTGILSKESIPFYLFFEIYNRIRMDSVRLFCRFLNSQREEVASYSKAESLSTNQTQIVWKIDSMSMTAQDYEITILAEGFSSLMPGRKFQAEVSRNCEVLIKDLPATIKNIDKAIDQLIYIAKGSEIDYIREGITPEDKQKRFIEFWEKRDPDPKTPENELMDEYYARIQYANKNFASFLEGWKTDRGMILIRFGIPENIERHPFNAEYKPYEIWYYYNQNREFIFIDDTGFGDYRLEYPTTDLWGRIR